jgi:hypothetical protein
MESRAKLFQKLKEQCVELAQAALALSGGRAKQQDIVKRLEILNTTLLSSTAGAPDVLDSKLADYVFFPLSQLLRESRQLSIRGLELCLQCVAILIEKGWREQVPPQLAVQVTILCSTLGEKRPKGLSFTEATDELRVRAFWCLYHLFSAIKESDETKQLLTNNSNVPQLGHTISVLLDGIEDGTSVESQVAAVTALNALVQHVLDNEIEAGFLPGIVSKLTKILTPQTKQRRNANVLTGCLGILELLLSNTMHERHASNSNSIHPTDDRQNTVIDDAWQQQAATQLKPALGNVLRLKSHPRADVRECLTKLCATVLGRCRGALSNCSSIALDTLIFIATEEPTGTSRFELESLVLSDQHMVATLQDMLYDWLESLTTTMQSHDEERKSLRIKSIGTVYKLLREAGVDLTTINRSLAFALRDSVIATLTLSKPESKPSFTMASGRTLELSAPQSQSRSLKHDIALTVQLGQGRDIDKIQDLAKLVGTQSSSSIFALELARDLQQSHGVNRLATFWLLLTLTQTMIEEDDNMSRYLDVGNQSQHAYGRQLEEIYSFSLSLLTDNSEEPTDALLLSLALRGLSLQARIVGREFRYELVNALYPVLHTLATPHHQLQQDSMETLSIFTSACGYASTRDTIVDNVDYLTNAVALKLNAFDVSPQAPQVLLMMIRLAGPSLLPYLEDTVESIFAALEDYHGYSVLVELLFQVLSAVADEGVKVPQLALAEPAANSPDEYDASHWQGATIYGLAALLQQPNEKREPYSVSSEESEASPQRPWRRDETLPDDEFSGSKTELTSQDHQMDDTDQPLPAPKTYNLLFKITELTQHFLPSASASLRLSLLALVKTTVPAIAHHENTFLPLINTLWPELVSRLDDEESYIVSAAIEVIGTLCEFAGSFMQSRILQLWPQLLSLQKTAVDALAFPLASSTSSILSHQVSLTHKVHDSNLAPTSPHVALLSHETSRGSPERMVTDALIHTMVQIVRNVQLPPEVLDEAFGVLRKLLRQTEVRRVLQKANPDALWLMECKFGLVQNQCKLTLPKATSWQFAELPEDLG